MKLLAAAVPDASKSRDDERNEGTGRNDSALVLDALVVGGGFAGVYLLHRLRQEGYKVKLVEAGHALGGIWHSTYYPGARVDSPYPIYALSIPEVYESWTWTEEYPSADEIRAYFRHVDKCINISRDAFYRTRVIKAVWDDETHTWMVECDTGMRVRTQYVHFCIGFATKEHLPEWNDMDVFEGEVCHSASWPSGGMDLRGKKIGLIGNGATGVQIAQTIAREAERLHVFVRTPNTCLPMRQKPIALMRTTMDKAQLDGWLTVKRLENEIGYLYGGQDRSMQNDTPEQREEVMSAAFDAGGFRPMLAYTDLLTDPTANRFLYDYWTKTTRRRIRDARKRDILAPLEPMHPFAGKRPSLEQHYYEEMDQPHVEVVNLREKAVSRMVKEGVLTTDGVLHRIDLLIFATGFDAFTGGFSDIDIAGVDGERLTQKWDGPQGVLSYLGMSVHNFPNMFYTYGPHSPAAYVNGPSVNEVQANWIVAVMNMMREEHTTKINAQKTAEQQWKEMIVNAHKMTLRDGVDSWYMGANIPGKRRQAFNYVQGLPEYRRTIWSVYEDGLKGFDLNKRS